MTIAFGFWDLLLWGVVSILFYYLMIHKSRRDKLLDVFPGPPRLPIIGHTLDFLFAPKEELFPMLTQWCEKYGSVVKTFSGSLRFLMISDPKYIEKILTSNAHIKKGFDYDFVRPWLGDGLLMSDGKKWFHRRKMLTPAFHFKILEDFMPIFNKESFKLVKILKNLHGNGSSFDFVPFITKCTLDIICETAMGRLMNAQDGDNLEYTQSIREFGEVVQDRAFRPWLRFEFIWKRSKLFARQEKLLKILHGFTNDVIQDRKRQRALMKKERITHKESVQNESVFFGLERKKTAFLDLLLDVQEEVGVSQMTDEDIREETDTFMFEGHDTTSVGISFTIYSLGAYPEIQANVRQELETIFGDDKTRAVTTEDLTKMKYLEAVIKESLRMYPSVPFIQRYLTSDLKLDDDIIIPQDVTVALFIYQIHKNPAYFPEPHAFKPERFLEGASRTNRNPFAYIPFSAGSRNCIGQKFAMMEEKVIIANLLRNFEIRSNTAPKDMRIQSELTIRSHNGISIQINAL